MTERNCNKCIHHTSGMCDSWDCKMQTVEDVKKEAVNEYVKSVVEELEKELSLADKEKERCTGENHLQFDSVKGYASGISTAIEIVKQGGVSDDVCEKMQMQAYNKAIDDFVNFANTMPTVEEEDGTIRPMWLEEMAEQLKEM